MNDGPVLAMSRPASPDNRSAIHYMGREAVFGDSKKIVCWGEETGEMRKMFPNPYWIIYADLRCVPSKTPPKIPKK